MPEETKVYKLRIKIPKNMKVEMIVETTDEEADTDEQGRIKWGDSHLTCCIDGSVVSPVSTVSCEGNPHDGGAR